MLSHKEQLNVLLSLNLTVHLLDEDNHWEIYSSTEEKAKERWKEIKKSFPDAEIKKVYNKLGYFNLIIDLYYNLLFKKANYKEIVKYIEENVKDIHFGGECTYTYGDSYIESVRGTSFKFVMWRDIIITEGNVLSIIPHDYDQVQNEVLSQLFKILNTEFFHVGSDEFDHCREFYKIKGILEESP